MRGGQVMVLGLATDMKIGVGIASHIKHRTDGIPARELVVMDPFTRRAGKKAESLANKTAALKIMPAWMKLCR